jgi:anoctamin-10
MAIQFGYLTMFASVAPWAACVCMLVNEAERRVDGYKMLYLQQRPGARSTGAESIGTWYQVFNMLTVAAVVTNCLIVGYTSTVLTHVYGLSGAQVL